MTVQCRAEYLISANISHLREIPLRVVLKSKLWANAGNNSRMKTSHAFVTCCGKSTTSILWQNEWIRVVCKLLGVKGRCCAVNLRLPWPKWQWPMAAAGQRYTWGVTGILLVATRNRLPAAETPQTKRRRPVIQITRETEQRLKATTMLARLHCGRLQSILVRKGSFMCRLAPHALTSGDDL